MDKDNSKNRNIASVIAFLVLAVALIVLCRYVYQMLQVNDQVTPPEDSVETIVTTISEKDDAEEQVTSEIGTAAAPVVTSAHVSPKKLACSEVLSEKNTAVVLDKNKNKTYKLNLKEIAEAGDTIETFTFVFHAEDGVSNLGEVKGGFGVSVDNKCPDKTDNIWYQAPDDFSVMSDGSSCVVTWKIPDEIKDYITVPTGQVLFGYWWSDVDSIVLDKIMCHRKTLKEVPVDDEKSIELNKPVKNAAPDNKITVPVSDLTGNDNELETVEIVFEGAEAISDLSGKFGIDTIVLSNGHYETINMGVTSESSAVKITWVLPDAVKRGVKNSGNFEFTLERCNLPELTVKNITVQYSLKQ